jgi:hypothetical protein
MNCRGCDSELTLTFLDLGLSPIANNLIEADQMNNVKVTYPLHVKTCKNCALVQLSENLPRETLFPFNYTYSSSISAFWLEHSKMFAEELVSFLDLNANDLVIEIASNDGYLLQFFKDMGIEVL